MKTLQLSSKHPLAENPQPLRVLPTSAFWRDRATRRLARPFLMGVLPPLGAVLLMLDLPLAANVAAMNTAMVLTFGLVERYVRARLNAST